MTNNSKIKKRGFVMTGGGAKGLYEAGVINAFHITGMNFDVITGSSIGAMNSVFYAEYQLKKQDLGDEILADPEEAVKEMDRLVRQFHHAWLLLPTVRIIDDSEDGPLGKLKDDLLKFDLNLPLLTRLGWWWTDPGKGSIPPMDVWGSLLKIGKELIERLGGAGELLRIIKDHREDPGREALRTYLARFGIDRSVVPDEDDKKLSDVFTGPVTPLEVAHIKGDVLPPGEPPEGESGLVDPKRTMRDYMTAGIDLRLTRANYRTGRLEISSYLSPENFIRYLDKHAWRLLSTDPDTIPLGSFRLQVPGNPNAINAGLASGRFPGVFTPYPVAKLYPADDPDNELLIDLLANWMDGEQANVQLKNAYLSVHNYREDADERWTRRYESWRDSEQMESFFPNDEDSYVDGGAIDNTPSNSVVDAIREWAEREDISRRDVLLDLYVVYLHKEPRVKRDQAKSPNTFEVIGRTLEIQGAAKLSSDAVVVDTINHFGDQGEHLGKALLALLEGIKESQAIADESQREALEARVRELAKEYDLKGFRGSSGKDILDRMEAWGKEKVDQKLPLPVEEIIIFPEDMPMDTLQFTERLGYRKENAIEMLTQGCYNTLWALRCHLEKVKDPDEQDSMSLSLTRKWMVTEAWSKEEAEVEELRKSWRCQRESCVYHAEYCARGAKIATER